MKHWTIYSGDKLALKDVFEYRFEPYRPSVVRQKSPIFVRPFSVKKAVEKQRKRALEVSQQAVALKNNQAQLIEGCSAALIGHTSVDINPPFFFSQTLQQY